MLNQSLSSFTFSSIWRHTAKIQVPSSWFNQAIFSHISLPPSQGQNVRTHQRHILICTPKHPTQNPWSLLSLHPAPTRQKKRIWTSFSYYMLLYVTDNVCVHKHVLASLHTPAKWLIKHRCHQQWASISQGVCSSKRSTHNGKWETYSYLPLEPTNSQREHI